MTKSALIFLHVPKTAGMTLRNIIQHQYDQNNSYMIGEDINADIISFRNSPTEAAHKIDALIGHMSFGLHRYMREPVTYITMLREPVKRSISDYRFIKGNPYHSVYHVVKDMTLTEFMNSNVNGQIRNGQTRLLCGDSEPDNVGIPTMRELDETDLEKAKANMENHVCVTGLQERFNESLLLYKKTLDWKQPFYTKTNVTPKTETVTPITDTEIELIKQRNALDIQLYKYACERFDELVLQQGSGFEKAVKSFQKQNSFLQTLDRFSWRRNRARIAAVARKLR